MLIGLASAAVLVAATVLIHYEALRLAGLGMERAGLAPRYRVLAIAGAGLVAHVTEIALFATAYYFGPIELGTLARTGPVSDSGFADYFYFSAVTYTTLGYGDLYPTGPLRVLAGMEALTGLTMIAWTATYTYAAARRVWELDSW